jgi:protoporphyrinogen oxidase
MSEPVEFVDLLVVGGGPSGLAAAQEGMQAGASVLLVEHSAALGGLARSATVDGRGVDLGGHRLLTNTARQSQFWHSFAEAVGHVHLHTVSKRSGILRDGVVLSYPVDWRQFRAAAPWGTRARGALSILKRKVHPLKDEDHLLNWVRNRYGDYLTDAFMAPHARKIFGVDPARIPATWASQRIAEPRVRQVLTAAIPDTTLRRCRPAVAPAEDNFLYPKGGIGVLWEGLARRITPRVRIRLATRITGYAVERDGVLRVSLRSPDGAREVRCRRMISTAPADHLARLIGLPRLGEAIDASSQHRDLVIGLARVGEVPDAWRGFQWLYTHGEGMRASRFQNYAEWTGLDSSGGLIGLEYPIPASSQAEPEAWVRDDLARLGIADYEFVCADVLSNAYANFDAAQSQITQLDAELKRSGAGTVSTGRQGAGIYINIDQAMALGRAAAAASGRCAGVAGLDTYSRYQERANR